jgi:DNA-binding CsgD family transcriptional regulator
VRIWISGVGVLVLAETGQDECAISLLGELERAGESVDQGTPLQRYVLAHRALGSARLGMRSEAADCYRQLLPFRGELAPVLIDRALGLAAWAAGKTEAAHLHFSEAAAVARRYGLQPELVLTLLNHAALQADHPMPDASNALRTQGLRLAEELSMTELGLRALRPLRSRRRPPEKRPAGLSAREIEVLRLVSQGLTNRQIAERLYVSEKTVARHLTTVYAKTGVDNRAGAAAFALRAGLA